MDVFLHMEDQANAAVRAAVLEGRLPDGALDRSVDFEQPRDPNRGDMATGWAVRNAKPLGTTSMALAQGFAFALSSIEGIRW